MVGVLALQGDFARHLEVLRRLGVAAREVRYAQDLEGLAALIIPGGESTTLLKLLDSTGLRRPLEAFVRANPVLGTCAGAILLARDVDALPASPFGTLDAAIRRNAYGRQLDSFEADVEIPALGPAASFRGVFIRAPRFERMGSGVDVFAQRAGEPVGLVQGRTLALAFHPELTDDPRIHRWFLETLAGIPVPVPASVPVENAS